MTIKKLKIANFYFTFKLNNKKKMPLKKIGLERLIGNISIKRMRGEGRFLARKGLRKNRGEGCDPQSNYGEDHCHRLCSEKGLLNVMAVANY